MVKFILRKYPVIYSFWCDFKWDSFFFFSLSHVSFLQPWLYRSLSADFQLVFSKNCSTCGGTFNIFMRRWVLYPPTLVILIYLLCVCVCVCVCLCVFCIYDVQSLGCIQLFVTPWMVTHQTPLSMGFFQARTLEWIAISFSRGSSWPRDRTLVPCISRQIITEPPEKPHVYVCNMYNLNQSDQSRRI